MGIIETAYLELSGDLAAAEGSAERTMEYGTRTGQPEAFAVYGAVLSELRLRQGRVAELVDLLVDVADQNPAIDAVQGLVFTCLIAVGRVDEARARFEQFRSRLPTLTRNGQWLSTMRHLSGAAVDLDDRDAALAVYDAYVPFADQVMFPTAIVEGAVGLQVGRLATYLGRYDEAQRLLDAALATHERIGARYSDAWTHLELATLCCARNADGDAARAREHVARSLALVDAHGFEGLRPRLDALQATLDG
jgi:tetratricopeptide (TPR) repeat protein